MFFIMIIFYILQNRLMEHSNIVRGYTVGGYTLGKATLGN